MFGCDFHTHSALLKNVFKFKVCYLSVLTIGNVAIGKQQVRKASHCGSKQQ